MRQRFARVLDELPTSLEPNTEYQVRTGEGAGASVRTFLTGNTATAIEVGRDTRMLAEDTAASIRTRSLKLIDYGFFPLGDPNATITGNSDETRLAQYTAIAEANTAAFAAAVADAKVKGAPGLIFPEGVCPYTDRGGSTRACLWVDGIPDFTLFWEGCVLERLVRDPGATKTYDDWHVSNYTSFRTVGTARLQQYYPISYPVIVVGTPAAMATEFFVRIDPDAGRNPGGAIATLSATVNQVLRFAYRDTRIRMTGVSHIRLSDPEVDPNDPDAPDQPTDPDNSFTVQPGPDGTFKITLLPAIINGVPVTQYVKDLLRPLNTFEPAIKDGDLLSFTYNKRGGGDWVSWNGVNFALDAIIHEATNTAIGFRHVDNPDLSRVRMIPRRGWLSGVAGFVQARFGRGTMKLAPELQFLAADAYSTFTSAFASPVINTARTTAEVIVSPPVSPTFSNFLGQNFVGDTLVCLSPNKQSQTLHKVTAVSALMPNTSSTRKQTITFDPPLPANYLFSTDRTVSWVLYNESQTLAIRGSTRVVHNAARACQFRTPDAEYTLYAEDVMGCSVMTEDRPTACGFRGGHIVTVISVDCNQNYRNRSYSTDISMAWTRFDYIDGKGQLMQLPAPRVPENGIPILLPCQLKGSSSGAAFGGVHLLGLDVAVDFDVLGAGGKRAKVFPVSGQPTVARPAGPKGTVGQPGYDAGVGSTNANVMARGCKIAGEVRVDNNPDAVYLVDCVRADRVNPIAALST